MTLARKLTLQLAALVVAVALIAAAALVGLQRLERRVDVAEFGYEKLQLIYDAGHHATTARQYTYVGADEVDYLVEFKEGYWALAQLGFMRDTLSADQQQTLEAVRGAFDQALEEDTNPAARRQGLNAALNQIATFASQVKSELDSDRADFESQVTATITVIAGLSFVTLISVAFIGFVQYRAVMRPLRAFDDAMARVAEANFTQRIEPASEAEFARLAERFNQMADRLDTLYRTLEDEVNTKSRALVRSERLAGVGYLAAGLAHEINNPLGIIGGYAEAALAKPDDTDRAAKALRVVADEAFRCKQITGKLLALARPTDAEPTDVDLASVLNHAAELMRGLEAFADHHVRCDVDDDLVVTGHASELTQVMINLLANALEATESGGSVTMTAERRGPWAQITVTDTGRGMSAEKLERIFEPFYTDAPERDRPGTGLGLAVTHAIVTQHGGRISAVSEGDGTGSAFTVELPLTQDVGEDAHD